MPEKTFEYGKKRYDYFLVHSNRKTLALTVYPTLHLVVKCPLECTEERVNIFLKRKWLWMETQLKFFKQFKGDSGKKEYLSGESLLYLGRQFKLEVKRGLRNEVTFSKGKILVKTKHDPKDGVCTRNILNQWYKERALEVFKERYKHIVKKFNFEIIPELELREMTKRWGSFVSNEKIILNPNLIKASKDCIDYVITHELCHLSHKNHSVQFFRSLSRKYPHWEKTKTKLELRFIGEHK